METQRKKRKKMKATIYSIKFDIFNGTNTISPVYEVHSWDKAEEIINSTADLIKDIANATFSFEVYGSNTASIW
jgi:hypothetical protein